MTSAEKINSTPSPNTGSKDTERNQGLSSFILKTAVVTFAFVFVLFAANIMFTYTLASIPKDVVKKVVRLGLDYTTSTIHKAAKGEVVTKARREQIQQTVRDVVVILKPFSDELKPLFENSACIPQN